ncbi:gluconate 2-dehydrogenase subunit 3 family protein [Sphingomonas parva]|nr:gluconate 2-dehydrogenase subunit 3 family protein [Sphingomonas parva]
MSSAESATTLDRRSLLQAAILLVGGSVAGLPASALAQAAAPAERFFSPGQFAILGEFADTMIPRTDTPGAKDAGVPEALDALMTNWASGERQEQFRALVDQIGATGLLAARGDARLALVKKFDAERLGAHDPVYGRFKDLLLTVYYLSEAGATKELRYELIPGKWEPAVTVGTDTRAWAV